MSEELERTAQAFLRFKEIIARLRDPKSGCPWDLKQTHNSLKQHLLEESYETLEAIDTSPERLCEELGDLLLQIFLHSQIAEEAGEFTLLQILQNITEKIIDRHPHIFGDTKVSTASEVKKNWEKLKQKKLNAGESILDSIPRTLPALLRAHRVGEKAASVNFDWRGSAEVKEKVREEIAEFLAERDGSKAQEEEFGDLLFVLAQLARHLGYSSEDLLQQACNKFERRLRTMESALGPKMADMETKELEEYWEQAKSEEKVS